MALFTRYLNTEGEFKICMKTYFIQQKLMAANEKYHIYDSNNKPCLEVLANGLMAFLDNLCGSVFSFGHKIYIKNLDGIEFAIINKRTGFLMEKYDVFCGGKNIASIKRQMKAFKPKFLISTDTDDYVINGDVMGRRFTISNRELEVAKVKKTTFDITDKYEINIFEDDNDELFLAMVIAMDNSIHN